MDRYNQISKIAYELYEARRGVGMRDDPIGDWLDAERIYENRIMWSDYKED